MYVYRWMHALGLTLNSAVFGAYHIEDMFGTLTWWNSSSSLWCILFIHCYGTVIVHYVPKDLTLQFLIFEHTKWYFSLQIYDLFILLLLYCVHIVAKNFCTEHKTIHWACQLICQCLHGLKFCFLVNVFEIIQQWAHLRIRLFGPPQLPQWHRKDFLWLTWSHDPALENNPMQPFFFLKNSM